MPTPEYDGVVTAESKQSEDDKKLLVGFFMTAVKDEGRSAAEGRPIFKEVPMVKIITPGSRDVYINKASQEYQERFPMQWERFQKRLEPIQNGTPLDQVPFLTVGQIAELRGVNCMTLEQLAGMSDMQLSKMQGYRAAQQKALAYLEAAKSAAPITQLKLELEQAHSDIVVLKRQIAELMKTKEISKVG